MTVEEYIVNLKRTYFGETVTVTAQRSIPFSIKTLPVGKTLTGTIYKIRDLDDDIVINNIK